MPPKSSNASDQQQASLVAAATTAVTIAGSWWLYKLFQSQTRWKKGLPTSLSTCPYAKELVVAMILAEKAGCNMMGYYESKGTHAEKQHDLDINTKGQPENFCTKIDIENERLVTDGLKKAFPTHSIIGEEDCGTGTIPPLTKNPTWIIDPVDGTTNFAAGLPLSCVSIGFCVDGLPVVGVVYAPMTQEWYIGVKGHGAFRNGVRISQREHTDLNEAVVCFEFGYVKTESGIDKLLHALRGLMTTGCRASRQIGSGVLDMCYVATGRLDGVYSGVDVEGWKPWDYCAGVVIAEEAGCVIEGIYQEKAGPFDLYSSSIICATSKELLESIRAAVTHKKK